MIIIIMVIPVVAVIIPVVVVTAGTMIATRGIVKSIYAPQQSWRSAGVDRCLMAPTISVTSATALAAEHCCLASATVQDASKMSDLQVEMNLEDRLAGFLCYRHHLSLPESLRIVRCVMVVRLP